MLKKILIKTKIIILFTCLINSFLFGQNFKALIDEDFSDWNLDSPFFSDQIGDQNTGNIDFGKFSIQNDSSFIYIYLEVGSEINLQSDNDITLYIDTDNNPATGYSVSGIGAELEYTFGNRRGTVRLNGSSTTIGHEDINLIAAPTVTSEMFELAINRNVKFFGNSPLFNQTSFKVVVKDKGAGGDQIPNVNGGLEYNFTNDTGTYSFSYNVERSGDLLRVVTYNVERDGFFDSQNQPYFTRILQALDPDIIVFEEIYNSTAQQTAALVETMLPSQTGEQWFNMQQGNDIRLVSRYPITSGASIDGNGAFLVDLSSKYLSDILIVGAHTPCCSNEDGRQQEIDNIMAFVRDAKNGSGNLTIENETPILITGDMNLVGYAQQLNTFITGNIINENLYGPDFNPDWDGSNFEDAKPGVTDAPFVFTWYDEGSSYGPGRLDFMFYSGSVMQLENSFVLFTPAMSAETLTQYGLQSNDAILAADHLPVVGDFRLEAVTSVTDNSITPDSYLLEQNYPNPFNPETKIEFSIPETASSSGKVKLAVYDLLGEEVQVLLNKNLSAGKHVVNYNASSLSSGVYIYRLINGGQVLSRKMILLK